MCTPGLATNCAKVSLSKLDIVKREQCESITRTVCTESSITVDNEICTYSYSPKTVKATAKTVEISLY